MSIFFFKVAELHALIGSREPLSNLTNEYREDPVYSCKLDKLCEGYKTLRKVRPDGNCFFRGFGYAYFEKILGDETEWSRFRDLVAGTKDKLLALGFPKFTLEDFYDSVYFMFCVLNTVTTFSVKCFTYESSSWMSLTVLEENQK